MKRFLIALGILSAAYVAGLIWAGNLAAQAGWRFE